jgi:DNA-binding NarL/FixJ family response regulator
MDKILVALVEDEAGTRARLEKALSGNSAVELIFSASTAQEMLDWLSLTSHKAVDVLLVDLGLPDRSGIDVIVQTQKLSPKTDCMVVTMFGDEANMIRAFEAGAKGYLLKDGSEDALSEHVMQLSQGGSPMSPIIARQLLSRLSVARSEPDSLSELEPQLTKISSPTKAASNSGLLTAREYEVLQYISRGYTYPELSRYLNVSLTTVLTHVRNIYSKLSVHNKTEAVFEARQMGLLD